MIDWERLSELIDEFGQEDFEDLLDCFWEELDAAIATLVERTGEDSNPASQFHFLKGAAGNLGLVELADFASAQERAANKSTGADLDVQSAQTLYRASKEILRSEGPKRFGFSFG